MCTKTYKQNATVVERTSSQLYSLDLFREILRHDASFLLFLFVFSCLGEMKRHFEQAYMTEDAESVQ